MTPHNFFTSIGNQGIAINQYVSHLRVLVQFRIDDARTQSNGSINPISNSLNVIPHNLMPFANHTNPAAIFVLVAKNQVSPNLAVISMPQSQRPRTAGDGVSFVYIAT
jgi:hypothetical protein